MVIVALFAVGITITSLITANTIVKPIRKIAQGAEEIARGNLDYEIDYESTNELGETVNSFNDMRLRLKESLDKQNKAEQERRVLVAGIAHDLRTPLTSAKGYAEGLLDGIADTPEKKDRYIRTICQSINHTERILDDLLTISRLELNGYEMNLTEVKAKEFLDELRKTTQVIIISDTFTQFAAPLMEKLGWPTIFCNSLEVAENGEITGFKMRIENSKYTTVKALQSIGYETIASGDSYNDLGMIQASKAGFLFKSTEQIKNDHPELPAFEEYDELLAAIKKAL